LPKCIGNVLRELDSTSYDYDERGNLITKSGGAHAPWRYRYDEQNRLIEASRHARPPAPWERSHHAPRDDSPPKPELVVRFSYDAFGRRIAKDVQRASGPAELTVFTWDGDVLLMEERFEALPRERGFERRSENARYAMVREDAQDAYSLPVAQRMHTLDAEYQWTRALLYLHEPGTFVPLARLDEKLVEPAFLATGTDGRFVQVPAKSKHATVFYQNDHLGTPQELLDESGKVVWLARYKAWGGRKGAPYGKEDPAETDNAIRFQGQYHDEETGLHYNRNRYYDPATGRYISQDPIGLAGGLNPFQYAPNPVTWVDPLGLCPKFGSLDKSQSHFEKHGAEFGVKSPEEYLSIGHDAIMSGDKVEYSYKGETRTGYVQYMGNSSRGDAKFVFVGTNSDGQITTIHTKSGKDLWKTLNGDGRDKTINSKGRGCSG
ncbi:MULTISPECIES: RHS repeat-associated core domain-containing protein, partial [unclassified Caballeronia]|uniref:RHS repeat-associated core domain-containing protein n=1 Tax=unclassified Caballeronia TaxID=2646786 RepID=UPI00285CA01B